MKNYYHLLGVKPEADITEIKKAYKKLAIKFHPDKNDGDEYFKERFQDIQEAFEVLSNIDLRNEYDKNLYEFDNNLFESIIPDVSLKVNKRSIEKGEIVIFRWTTTNIVNTEIFENNKKTGIYASNGEIKFNPFLNTKYQFVFNGKRQSITKTININVKTNILIEEPIVKLLVNKNNITVGEEVLFKWTTEYVSHVHIENFGIYGANDRKSFYPTEKTKYNFKFIGDGGVITKEIVIDVTDSKIKQIEKKSNLATSLILSAGLFLILFFLINPWVYNLFDWEFNIVAQWWPPIFFSVSLFFSIYE